MINKSKKWTNENIDELINLSKTHSPYEISLVIDRTKKSIENKLFRLGIKQFERFRETKKCLFCSNEIYDLKSNKRKFCNTKCSSKYNSKKRDIESYNSQKRSLLKTLENKKIYLICKFCNIEFLGSPKSKFCSNNCRSKNNYESFPINQKDSLQKECLFCNHFFFSRKNSQKFCNKRCFTNFNKEKKIKKTNGKFLEYKSLCLFTFSLSNYKDEFNFSLIEKYGWYSPSNKNNNLNGVSRDHMFSVSEGFEKGIDPKLISHPANCELMLHNKNSSKGTKSSLNLNELIERIKIFDLKYKNDLFHRPFLIYFQ